MGKYSLTISMHHLQSVTDIHLKLVSSNYNQLFKKSLVLLAFQSISQAAGAGQTSGPGTLNGTGALYVLTARLGSGKCEVALVLLRKQIAGRLTLTVCRDMTGDCDQRRVPIASVYDLDLGTRDPPLRVVHGAGEGGAFCAEKVLHRSKESVTDSGYSNG